MKSKIDSKMNDQDCRLSPKEAIHYENRLIQIQSNLYLQPPLFSVHLSLTAIFGPPK